jgi:multidrug efflux pump subunit AcrB
MSDTPLPEKRSGIAFTLWAIDHPVGTVMLALAIVVIGFFSLQKINIDLLPHIIYPDVRVRILNPGVPAKIMEDEVTRQLEEQLAITEDAIHVESTTTEGRSSVDLSFSYQKDVDIALRDASTRLDRAKRFLPDEIDPPVIYKRDPFQLPIAEYVISSNQRDAVSLRSYVDYELGKQLLNLPGVAAAEVGGGLVREVQVIADQDKLASLEMDILDIEQALVSANTDIAAGRLIMSSREISGRTSGRFQSVDEIRELPISLENSEQHSSITLNEVARIIDGSEEEKLRIRFDDNPGIKLSMQKQPQANTVAVVDVINEKLDRLKAENLLPDDININQVSNQARYIEQSLSNASQAALSGAVLAMIIVYLFLGNIRRTLVISSVIPIAILVTFIIMAISGLTLNIMTLGGLALGIGMLVDNTIVMLENIYRHQKEGESNIEAARHAAREVSGAIFASTSTNLAAVLPFLLIGGLIGLLFKELIFTISAAIVASLIIALTLTPTLAARIKVTKTGKFRHWTNKLFAYIPRAYSTGLGRILKFGWLLIPLFIAGLYFSWTNIQSLKQAFLPSMDEGVVSISLTSDEGNNLDTMDELTRKVEQIISKQPGVLSQFTTVGGFIFGRSTFESANRANIMVQLASGIDSQHWIAETRKAISQAGLPGLRTFLKAQGIRGIRINQGDDDISLRIKGPDLDILTHLGDKVVKQLQTVKGINNVQHSSEEITREVSVRVDRDRAASFGLTVEEVGKAVRIAVNGSDASDFIADDRSVNILLRLDRNVMSSPADLAEIILFSKTVPRQAIRLSDVASIIIEVAPGKIMRDRQQRIVEITATMDGNVSQKQAILDSLQAANQVQLPEGYILYEAGGLETLKEGEDLSQWLLGLAIFLVFVVMAVQYESLRNPLIILLSIPFCLIGVNLGLEYTGLPLSMPVWLGLIMLAGIVVNNAIVLVEYIEIERDSGKEKLQAIVDAVAVRLRPIMMTTLTTVFGMLPLAMAWAEGSEMLQPLAVTLISGLLFATLVSLLLVPVFYQLLGLKDDYR